jgi:hypothetical protein
MGKGARVLDELIGVQAAHVGYALHRPRAQVGSKLLIAEYGQPSLRQSWNQSAAQCGRQWYCALMLHRFHRCKIGIRHGSDDAAACR